MRWPCTIDYSLCLGDILRLNFTNEICVQGVAYVAYDKVLLCHNLAVGAIEVWMQLKLPRERDGVGGFMNFESK